MRRVVNERHGVKLVRRQKLSSCPKFCVENPVGSTAFVVMIGKHIVMMGYLILRMNTIYRTREYGY